MQQRQMSVKAFRFLGVGLFLMVLGFQVVGVAAQTLVWSASFESGSYRSYFNSNVQTSCGAVDTVSTSIVHTGSYSEYDYYTGGPAGTSCRAYPAEQLSTALASFQLEVWVYVPSASLNDWVSFITLRLSDNVFITVDSNARQELHLYDGALSAGQRLIFQASPIEWPFDAWFKLTVVATLKPGTSNSHIQVFQDGVKILDFTGYAGNGLLYRMHFGLYIGSNQGSFGVYNDDIKLWQP